VVYGVDGVKVEGVVACDGGVWLDICKLSCPGGLQHTFLSLSNNRNRIMSSVSVVISAQVRKPLKM
jgi:hypothetical protein